jgi:dipeptidyl aminopeptidase/acylaminoacyl peptidase
MNRSAFRLAPVALAAAVAAVSFAAAASAASAPRPLRVDDIFSLRTVSDPQLSPDGSAVAYTVRWLDPKEDTSDSDLYLVPFAGGEPLRLTASPKPESHPRFSPDGRYLAFLSGRDGKKSQVWLLDRRGGEAVRLSDYKADVADLAWSPDGKRLALVVGDVDPDDPESQPEGDKAGGGKPDTEKTPKPIVIHRLQFLRDGEGFLRELHQHLYVLDVATRANVQVTSGPYDDNEPAWSPDGRTLAFASNRTKDPDANDNSDIFLVEARAGQTPRAVVTSPGTDHAPAFSPDGKWIAYVAGGEPKDIWYATTHLAVVPVAGGEPRALTLDLDRNVEAPRFAPDGKAIYFLIEEGGNGHLARIPAAGGPIERVVDGDRVVQAYSLAPHGEIAVLESTPQRPFEISAVSAADKGAGSPRRLTRTNDAFLAGIRLGEVKRFQATSADGTKIDAFLTLPPGARPGVKLPTILRIHGGPTAQYDTAFQTEWQMLAAHGFAVVASNPRGSMGYGSAFSRAIWADWGNKDYQDVMSAVDGAIAMGVADPDRLGVGGWSYGGILTDHVLTKTQRFKAATSGASEVNYLANYGTDHYQKEWEAELGLPWQHPEAWTRISPFFRVDRITTPTLILGGAEDVNVPLLNAEQLYQALRRLGRDTELVIYPGQSHGISKPSYQKDRYERYLAWYGKYLKGEGSGEPAAAKSR